MECEIQDENGEKASQLLKNWWCPSLSSACSKVIMFTTVFVNTILFRCPSSRRYVRTNSPSEQVTRGCVNWTIVTTIDKNVSHETKDKVRILSRGNISLSFLTLDVHDWMHRKIIWYKPVGRGFPLVLLRTKPQDVHGWKRISTYYSSVIIEWF